jgi:acyl carrier protein
MADNITEKVLDLIASVKRVPREKLTPDSTFAELGMDSLDAINLIFEIENEFDISVPDEAAKSITGVRDLVEKLQQIIAASSSGSAASGTA